MTPELSVALVNLLNAITQLVQYIVPTVVGWLAHQYGAQGAARILNGAQSAATIAEHDRKVP